MPRSAFRRLGIISLNDPDRSPDDMVWADMASSPSQPAGGRPVAVGGQKLGRPGCKKTRYARHGRCRGEHGDRQICKRPVCGRRFRDSLGFECRHAPRLYTTLALVLSGMGMAVANMQTTLRHLGVKVHVDAMTRTLEYCSGMVERHTGALRPPCTGDKWGCDEKRQKVRGRGSHVVAVMDLATRFVPAWDISPTREKYGAAPLLRAARGMAGRIPRLFVTGGLERHHIAFKTVFRALKGPMPIHIRDIHIRNLICNTNKHPCKSVASV